LFRILNLCTVCRLALCVIDMTANLLIMEWSICDLLLARGEPDSDTAAQ
jgi:hypothetical protein